MLRLYDLENIFAGNIITQLDNYVNIKKVKMPCLHIPGQGIMIVNEAYVTRDKLQSFFHKYPLVDMIIYFTLIANEIKVIYNINLAMLFSGVERYNITFIIITPIVWNPFLPSPLLHRRQI